MSQPESWQSSTASVITLLDQIAKRIHNVSPHEEDGVEKVLDECHKFVDSLKDLEGDLKTRLQRYDSLLAVNNQVETMQSDLSVLQQKKTDADQELARTEANANDVKKTLEESEGKLKEREGKLKDREVLVEDRDKILNTKEQSLSHREMELNKQDTELEAKAKKLDSRETVMVSKISKVCEADSELKAGLMALENARLSLRQIVGRTVGCTSSDFRDKSVSADFEELSKTIVDRYSLLVRDRQEKMNLQNELTKTNEQLSSVSMNCGSLEAQVLEFENSLSRSKETTSRLENELILAKENIERLGDAEKGQKSRIRELTNELQGVKNNSQRLDQTVSELRSSVTTNRADLSQQRTRTKELRISNEALEKRTTDLYAQLHESDASTAEANAVKALLMEALNKQNDKNVKVCNEEVAMRRTITELRTELSVAKDHSAFVAEQGTEFQQRIKDLEEDNLTQGAELEHHHQSQIELAELKAKAGKLQTRHIELQTSREMCKRKDDLIKTLNNQLEEKQAALKRLTKQNQTLEFAKIDVEEDLHLKAQEKNEVMANCVQQRTQSRCLEERVKTVVEQRDKANADLAEARQGNRDLGRDLEAVTVTRDELQDVVKEYEAGLGGEESTGVEQPDAESSASGYDKLRVLAIRYRRERDILQERIGDSERGAAPATSEAQQSAVDNMSESSLPGNLSRSLLKRQREGELGEVGDTPPPSKHFRRHTRFDNPGHDDSSNDHSIFDETALQYSGEQESGRLWGQGTHSPFLDNSLPETRLASTGDEVQVPATQKDRTSGTARPSAGITADGRTADRRLGQDQDDEAEENKGLTPLENTLQSTPNGPDVPPDVTEDPQIPASKSNTAAQRRPPILRPGTTWAIDDVLDHGTTSDRIPLSIIATVQAQIKEWDNRDRKWRNAGLTGFVCADRWCAKKKVEWVDDDTNYACVKCTALKMVCCRVMRDRILALPVKGEQGGLLRPINEAYWRNQ